MLPQKIYFDPTANKLIFTDNNIIYEPERYPRIYVGEQDSIVNVQLIKNKDIAQPYTYFKSGVVAKWLTNNSYNNAYLYNLVKANSDLWTASTVEGEYFCKDISEKPEKVIINGVKATLGAKDSLAENEYAYAESEKRIYIRLVGNANPDEQTENYIQWLTSGATPYIESTEEKFNQPNTWYDTETKAFRVPDIEQGEISFIISADKEAFIKAINDSAEIPSTKTQIQFYENGKLFLIYEFIFRCLNRFMSNGISAFIGNPLIVIGEAPMDGKLYARQNGEWVEVVGGGLPLGAVLYMDEPVKYNDNYVTY